MMRFGEVWRALRVSTRRMRRVSPVAGRVGVFMLLVWLTGATSLWSPTADGGELAVAAAMPLQARLGDGLPILQIPTPTFDRGSDPISPYGVPTPTPPLIPTPIPISQPVPPSYPPGAVPPSYPPGAAPPSYPPGAAPPSFPPGAVPSSFPPGAVPPSGASPDIPPMAMPIGDPCWGDEVITFAPEKPRVNDELIIAVTSARPHPYGRVAGTERTTFVRERPGQLGIVWEWTVALTWPGRHHYTFYVDSTIPCKDIEIVVRQSIATKTPTPYGDNYDYYGDNQDGDNDDGDNQDGDNN